MCVCVIDGTAVQRILGAAPACSLLCAAGQAVPRESPHVGNGRGLEMLQEKPHLLFHSATKKVVGLWLWPCTGPFWKEPNSLPNPELLPGFLSWKPFLMGTPLCCGKSNSSSESQGSMLSPSQLDQLCCLPLLHSRYFSFNSPSRVFCGLLSLSPSGQAVIWVSLGAEPCAAVPLRSPGVGH